MIVIGLTNQSLNCKGWSPIFFCTVNMWAILSQWESLPKYMFRHQNQVKQTTNIRERVFIYFDYQFWMLWRKILFYRLTQRLLGTVKSSWNDGVNEWLRRLNPDSISSSRVASLLPIGLRMSSLKLWLLSRHQFSLRT